MFALIKMLPSRGVWTFPMMVNAAKALCGPTV